MNPAEEPVLVVEDDADLREGLALLLEAEGMTVVTAHDGQEALERLSAEPHPCLMLLDLMMPGMNGYELLERVRGTPLAQTPIIVCSANPPASGVDSVAAVMRKPFDIDDLLRLVRRCCRSSERCGASAGH